MKIVIVDKNNFLIQNYTLRSQHKIVLFTKLYVIMKNYFLIAVFLAVSNFAQAQESLNTSGGVDAGTGGTVSFSVGQMVYTTDSKGAGAVVQGIQRPYRITTTDIKKLDNSFSFKAYPNPSSDVLFLEMDEFCNEKLNYQLYDVQGKLLITNPIELAKTQINMRSFSVGTYLIQIYNSENQPIQTIQIIKN